MNSRGDVVPGVVLVELLAEIGLQRVGGDERPVFDPAVEDHVPPVAGPVEAVLRVGEQVADHRSACRARVELKAITCSGVGMSPTMSSHARRRKVASSHCGRHVDASA